MTTVEELPEKINTRNEASKLKQEAKDILYKLFNLPDGYSSLAADRFVDCIISATRLDIAADFRELSSEI